MEEEASISTSRLTFHVSRLTFIAQGLQFPAERRPIGAVLRLLGPHLGIQRRAQGVEIAGRRVSEQSLLTCAAP